MFLIYKAPKRLSIFKESHLTGIHYVALLRNLMQEKWNVTKASSLDLDLDTLGMSTRQS